MAEAEIRERRHPPGESRRGTRFPPPTSAGHGGDLFQGRGDFNLVNLAWLNWQLKGDEGATGKGFLHGPSCQFCTDSGWEYLSANVE